MSCHNHARPRQALTQFQPASVKQLDVLTSVHPGHACRWWMSQGTLELGMLQDLISSPPRHKIDACLVSRRVITAASPYCRRDSPRATSGARVKCLNRSRWPAGPRQAHHDSHIAPACIGADPLARMHLQRSSACADHLPSLASCVATRETRRAVVSLEGVLGAGQSRLSCGLPVTSISKR